MKFDDVNFIINNIQNDMSIHTDNTFKIPTSYGQLTKEPMELSHKVQNKYLNKHLAEIEEAYHCKVLSPLLLQSFLYQNKKYHLESGILNHDNFFTKDTFEFGYVPKGTYFQLPFAVTSRRTRHSESLLGIEIEVAGSGSNTIAAAATLYGSKITGAIANASYDQIAISVSSAVGNHHMGNYTDNSGSPNVLIVDSGDIAVASGYTYESVTEWTQDGTTNVWCGYLQNNAGNTVNNFTGSGNRTFQGETYGALPDPYTVGFSSDTTPHKMKITHS